MRILIVAPNWIGDAVMAQPLLAQIRRQSPDLSIDAVAAPHIVPVMQAMPEIADVIAMPLKRGALQLTERRELAELLRLRQYSRCYVLPNNLKAALAPWMAGIPERIGHRGEARYGLINRMRKVGKSKDHAMVDYYAQLALAPGETLTAPSANPVLSRDPAAEQLIRQQFVGDGPGPLVAFCPGAEFGPAKRWPTRHFANLASQILVQWPDAKIAIMGSAKERPLATEISALCGHPLVKLCGETTMQQALAIIAQADGVVSNDSGLMHVAAAYNRPLVAIFGSSDPRHTPPRSAHASVHWLKLDCSPCFSRECRLGHTDCLNNVSPAGVMVSLQKAMQFNPAQRLP